jgi:hypothetical protein
MELEIAIRLEQARNRPGLSGPKAMAPIARLENHVHQRSWVTLENYLRRWSCTSRSEFATVIFVRFR